MSDWATWTLDQVNEAIERNERSLVGRSISHASREAIIGTIVALKRERTRRWLAERQT